MHEFVCQSVVLMPLQRVSRQGTERHDMLQFICRCKAYMPGTGFHTLSELRRRLMRGLMFLVFGRD